MSKLEDELALRNLMARYVDAVHSRDEDDWAGNSTKDARSNLQGSDVNVMDNIDAL